MYTSEMPLLARESIERREKMILSEFSIVMAQRVNSEDARSVRAHMKHMRYVLTGLEARIKRRRCNHSLENWGYVGMKCSRCLEIWVSKNDMGWRVIDNVPTPGRVRGGQYVYESLP